jgi:hypothetical protein
MSESSSIRDAMNRFKGTLVKNGTPPKVAEKKAKEAAQRADRRIKSKG